jgi:hypothetical protein
VENFQNTKVINFSKNGIAIKSVGNINFEEKSIVDCNIGPNKFAKLLVETKWKSDDGTMGLEILESSESWQMMITKVLNDNILKKSEAA